MITGFLVEDSREKDQVHIDGATQRVVSEGQRFVDKFPPNERDPIFVLNQGVKEMVKGVCVGNEFPVFPALQRRWRIVKVAA